jgi:hypothetical protein
MVVWVVARCPAGLDCPLDRGNEVLPTGISQGLLQVTGKPKLHLIGAWFLASKSIELILHLL